MTHDINHDTYLAALQSGLQAIIFDFDGTILNTEAAEFAALADVFAEHGTQISHDDVMPYIGGATEIPWLDILAERATTSVDFTSIRAKKNDAARRHVETLAPRPGIIELLAEASSAGIALGIASNAPRWWVESHTTRLGIRDYFTAILGVDDVRLGKPHPQLYVDVCCLVGADPLASLAIEDSAPGVNAAIAAGLTCIVSPTQITHHVEFHPAAIRIESLDGVRLNDLVGIHQRRTAAGES